MKLMIPVGGRGTRLLPLTKSFPKEMFPLGDKPILQHLLEEGKDAGLEGAVVIVSPSKIAIKKYFQRDQKEEERLGKRIDKLKGLNKLIDKFPIDWATQKYPLGDGHALMCGKSKLGFFGKECAVVFGDTLFDNKGKNSVLKQMLKEYKKTGKTLVGVKRVGKKEVSRFGVVDVTKTKNGLVINKLVEKPKVEDAPSNLVLTGIYILSKGIWRAMKKAGKSEGGEWRLADGLAKLIETEEVRAFEIKEEWLDTGTTENYQYANYKISKKLGLIK